jgi:hypothetical protein
LNEYRLRQFAGHTPTGVTSTGWHQIEDRAEESGVSEDARWLSSAARFSSTFPPFITNTTRRTP